MRCNHPIIMEPYKRYENGLLVKKYRYKHHLDKWTGILPPDWKLVPCGQCIACRINRSAEWANRMMLEAMDHDENYFVTLTYNNDFLPTYLDQKGKDLISKADDVYDDSYPFHSLDLHDLQQFFKSLRQILKEKYPDNPEYQTFRYYACGEYSPNGPIVDGRQFPYGRPHYHIIFFGLHLEEDENKTRSEKSKCGYPVFNNKTISEAWSKFKKTKGFAVCAPVSWETCAYTARYCQKKLYGEQSDLYDDLHIKPEFAVMSRKPGIARKYYDENRDEIYKFRKINLSTPTGGKAFKPPRYFDNLYDQECPEEAAAYRERCEEYLRTHDVVRKKLTNCTLYDELVTRELKLSAQVNKLKRNGSDSFELC